VLKTFEQFLADEQAWDMYITGAAGTGKTTSLGEVAEYCIKNDIAYTVCAYTHKACGILKSKLPESNIRTLHSFLGKRPCINTHATKKEHVNINTSASGSDELPRVLFIDEYSMIGEKDFLDIRAMQDADYDGIPELKVVWIGDRHQLPPVGDMQAIIPDGDYQVLLTKIWRNDNPLQRPLNALISYMEGTAQPEPLQSVLGYFERDKDVVAEYVKCQENKVLLAYTNQRVEALNAEIAGKTEPEIGNKVFSPTTQKTYVFQGWETNPYYIDLHYSEPIPIGSKYRTLENLRDTELCLFAKLEDEDGNQWQHAVIFGHYDYKTNKEYLERQAVKTNKAIEVQHKGYKAAGWAKANAKKPLARTRAKAWRDCLSFKDCVICIDFPYAMTVHKSQGSTFNTVFVDTDDIAICADRNFDMYLKLVYVAISRASHKVITS
jgi:hypothetical protein